MKARKLLAITSWLVLALSITPLLKAQEIAAKTQVFRYACIDENGRNTDIIELRVTPNPDGGMEIISTDSLGMHGYARLNAAMLQEEVRISTSSGALVSFRLTAPGGSWKTEEDSGNEYSCAGNARLGDRSLFFILPTLIDPKKTGDEARFVLVRTEGGQRATMRLRAEGIAEVTDYSGKKEWAYRISMGLADPIGRLFWPYMYNYYYRVQDLRFLAYDGPDENKRKSRIILIDAAIPRS